MKYRFIFLVAIFLGSNISFSQAQGKEEFPSYEITIKRAKGLTETDVGKKNKTDPYAILYRMERVERDSSYAFKQYLIREIGRTKVIQDTNNPAWKYTVKFQPKNQHEMTNRFFIRVVDEDKRMSRDKDIGWFEFEYGRNVEDKILQCDTSRSKIIDVYKGFRGDFAQIGNIRMPWEKRRTGTVRIGIKKFYPDITMPNYVGKKWSEVKPQIDFDSSINSTYRTKIITDESKDGIILRQYPASGTRVKHGSSVRLHVGKIKKINMPDFRNMRMVSAYGRMRALKLKSGKTTYKETSNPRFHSKIVGQTPLPGTILKVPATVDFVIFKYVRPEPVDFPDVSGLSYEDAYEEIRDAGLGIGNVTKKPVDDKSGVVVGTNPVWEEGMQLQPGTRISLVIAAPELLGMSMAFPIAKQPGEMMTLDFNKAEKYYVKFVADQKGYIRFITPDGTEDMPLSGDFFIPGEEKIASYSDWYDRRIFKVLPEEYFMEFSWDNMTTKTAENAVVKFKYEIVPEMDPVEPNDTIDEATNINAGVRNDIAIYPGEESDWFTYTADADGYLRLTLEDVPEEIHHAFMFEIYEEGSDENLHAAEYSPVSVKVFKGKKYFIRLSVLGRDRTPKTFGLTLDLILEKDPTEPNDTLANAYPLEGDFTGTFYFMGKAEKDYFKVYPPKWARYMVLSALHPEYLMIPRVYWGRDQQALDDSDYHKLSHVPTVIPIDSSAPYYLYASNEHPLKFSDIPFELNISYFPGTDVNNANTSMESATPIKRNEPVAFLLAPPGNEDWFGISGSENQEIFVKVDNAPEEDIKCRLINEEEDTVESLMLSSDPQENKFIIPTSGQYYLQIYFDYSNISSHREMAVTILDKAGLDSLAESENEPVEEVAQPEVSDKQKSIDLASQAYALFKKSEYEKSIDLYKQAIDLYEDERYWHDMGIAYFQQKKWDDAQKCFKKAIEIEPNYFFAHKSLGSVYGELKDYEASLKEFQSALALNRDDAMLYYNIARSYEGMHVLDESKTDALNKALEFAQKALDKLPGNDKVKKQYDRISQKLSKIKG